MGKEEIRRYDPQICDRGVDLGCEGKGEGRGVRERGRVMHESMCLFVQ